MYQTHQAIGIPRGYHAGMEFRPKQETTVMSPIDRRRANALAMLSASPGSRLSLDEALRKRAQNQGRTGVRRRVAIVQHAVRDFFKSLIGSPAR
jgi:hypothetical protein